MDFCLAVGAVEPHTKDGAQENAASNAGSQRTNGQAIVLGRRVLGNEHPGTRHFTANRSALQHAHQQQQQGRGQANGFIGRQQANDQCGHRHQKDGQREHLLAANLVAIVRNDDAAQGRAR